VSASTPGLAFDFVARRRIGAGRELIADKIAPYDVAGPELHSHLEIALAVASGIADAGLGLRAGVADLGLEFIPLTWESYDIALGGAAHGAARPLITALHDPAVQESILRLGGYDLELAGTLQPLGESHRLTHRQRERPEFGGYPRRVSQSTSSTSTRRCSSRTR
jgi:PBP superfamily domain